MEYNRSEKFNLPLLKQLGDLGLLGLTVEEEYGGHGLDATATALVHEELSYSDPAFCLSYLAHSLLLVNNISINGSSEQKQRFLPTAISGEKIGGVGMSEPNCGMYIIMIECMNVNMNDEIQFLDCRIYSKKKRLTQS